MKPSDNTVTLPAQTVELFVLAVSAATLSEVSSACVSGPVISSTPQTPYGIHLVSARRRLLHTGDKEAADSVVSGIQVGNDSRGDSGLVKTSLATGDPVLSQQSADTGNSAPLTQCHHHRLPQNRVA